MLYPILCQNAILPFADILTGRSIHRYHEFLSQAQWWAPEKIREYQLVSLRKTLKYAWESIPYYRNVFNDKNFSIHDFSSISDLGSFPILTKKIINEQQPESMVQCSLDHLIKASTSGSTGKQANFYFSKKAQSFTYAAQLQFFNWADYQLGDSVLQTGMSFPRGVEKRIKDFVYRCHYVSAFNLSEKDLDRIHKTILRKKPQFIIGYASSLFCIAKYFLEADDEFPLKGVISLGDMLFPHYRDVIEKVFQTRVTDTYGSCEGFMVAGQCEHGQYHISMPLNIVEIVDDNGNNLPEGELGRIVLTRLDNNPMPLIRYDIGDMGILSKSTNCDCKRGYATLEKILGRNTDIVVTPNGHKLIVHFFTAIFEYEESVDEFQVLQKERDRILILLVTRPQFSKDVENRILKKIHEKCNGDIKVDFEIVDSIPASSSGKRRFVISDYTLKIHEKLNINN